MQSRPQEKFVPIHMRDFTDQIQQYMSKYPAMKRIYKDIPMRRYMWDVFSAIVAMHITEYAVPQYKDYPNDQWTNWQTHDFITQIQKYANRLESNSRGEEEMYSDLLKMANYCCICFLAGKGYTDLFVEPELDNNGNPLPPVSQCTVTVPKVEEGVTPPASD